MGGVTPRSRSRQKPPGSDLTEFPDRRFTTRRRWWRCHQTRLGAWFYASEPGGDDPGGGRWDLPAPEGTSYLADSDIGALLEVIGPDLHDHGFVTEEFLAARSVSTVQLPHSTRAADLHSDDVARFGVTSELTGAISYLMTRRWASAWRRDGFQAVSYGLRFRPNSSGLALFGPAGPADHVVLGPVFDALTVADLNAVAILRQGSARLSDFAVVDPAD